MSVDNDTYQQLKDITDVVIRDEDGFAELSMAIKQFREMLMEISFVDPDKESNRLDIHTDSGKTLGSAWAVSCLDDLLRTKRFIKGMFEAVVHRNSGRTKPVHVLYAGTGPFAALVLPLITRFTPAQLQFTLIEINETSYRSMERTVKAFGMEPYIRNMIQDDATLLQLPDPGSVDILLSETMQHALKREQQVPIVLNLLAQLDDDVILVPENIILDACLYNSSRFTKRIMTGDADIEFAHILGKIFKLNKYSSREFITTDDTGRQIIEFPEITLDWPKDRQPDGFDMLSIFTTVQIYGENRLQLNDSGITIPLILEDMSRCSAIPSELIFKYAIGDDPGIVYQFA